MTTTPPLFIGADTYTGKHTVRKRSPKTANYRASELTSMAPEGVLWESFGVVFSGVEGFSRGRYVAGENGDLYIYSQKGQVTIIHPADRILRILVK